jgi:hypothetical protein
MHYVIVVHGIGEQRKNETVLNVINRFAEARRNLSKKELDGILTLGKASGQTEKEEQFRNTNPTSSINKIPPWIEFRGIPQPKLKHSDRKQFDYLNSIPFYGEDVPDGEKGQNIRFVDLCWADIMKDSNKDIYQPVETWAKGLMGRLKLKNKNVDDVKREIKKLQKSPEHKNNRTFAYKLDQCENARVPQWIIKLLSTLVAALILTKNLMNFRFKEMKDLIFMKFLGDVQLYGEFPITRGKAVRRFHRLMARIEEEHKSEMADNDLKPQEKPTYTIIAHSLGTIMSLDSLLYAHASKDIRTGIKASNTPNMPFPGYCAKDDLSNKTEIDYFSDTSWVERVKYFVTLGSPIDKYLVMWWLNYKYLLEPDTWMASTKNRIAHFNYSDELDPVGHNLDVAKIAPAFRKIFNTKIDVVFNRYSMFGAAHNEYWKDTQLFKNIFANTVDKNIQDDAPKPVKTFMVWKYFLLIATTYIFVPLTLSAFAAMSFEWVFLSNHSTQTNFIALVVLVSTLWVGSKLIKILVLGRQTQRIKAKKAEKSLGEKWIRKGVGLIIKVTIPLLPIFLVFYAELATRNEWTADIFTLMGMKDWYHSASYKWFVAITYIYLGYYFLNYKINILTKKIDISDYRKFFEDPIKGHHTMEFNSEHLEKGSKGPAVEELQIRLAGFRGTVWDGDFGPGTELQVITFKKEYMNLADPTGIVDSSVFNALKDFAKEFPIDFDKLKCPCQECEGFGRGQFKNEYRSGKPEIEAYHQLEYPGIHKAILHSYRAAQFYAKHQKLELPFFTSGYRCHINNDKKKRKSTNHMGKALDCDFPLGANEDKRDDTIRCENFRGLLVEKSNFQIGWNGRNKKSLEPSHIAPTWIHMDVRSFSPKYLDEKYFVTTEQALDSNDI